MKFSTNWSEPKVYAVKHRNDEIRVESRSGGVFTALSDKVFDKGGVVYGCVLDEEYRAIHLRAEDKDMRNRMRGSKYIQSDMGDIFIKVRSDLLEGRTVLFSGTSCQIMGLKSFLEKDFDNLFCVDIVCHGVPSPKVWREYLDWQEKRTGQKIISVDFRNKKDYGWEDHIETLYLKNGKKIDSRIYTTLFYEHSIIRPSCFKCPYKDKMHPSDITLADYWGIDKAVSGFNDNKGVSLVLVNNDVGLEAFEKIKEEVQWCETRLEDCLQPPLISPFEEPLTRTEFWKDFNEQSFTMISRKYGGNNIKKLIVTKYSNLKKRIKAKISGLYYFTREENQ